jgi:hypothetical protein
VIFLGVAALEERAIVMCVVLPKVRSLFSPVRSSPVAIYDLLSEGEIFIWNRDTGLLLHAIRPANDEHVSNLWQIAVILPSLI